MHTHFLKNYFTTRKKYEKLKQEHQQRNDASHMLNNLNTADVKNILNGSNHTDVSYMVNCSEGNDIKLEFTDSNTNDFRHQLNRSVTNNNDIRHLLNGSSGSSGIGRQSDSTNDKISHLLAGSKTNATNCKSLGASNNETFSCNIVNNSNLTLATQCVFKCVMCCQHCDTLIKDDNTSFNNFVTNGHVATFAFRRNVKNCCDCNAKEQNRQLLCVNNTMNVLQKNAIHLIKHDSLNMIKSLLQNDSACAFENGSVYVLKNSSLHQLKNGSFHNLNYDSVNEYKNKSLKGFKYSSIHELQNNSFNEFKISSTNELSCSVHELENGAVYVLERDVIHIFKIDLKFEKSLGFMYINNVIQKSGDLQNNVIHDFESYNPIFVTRNDLIRLLETDVNCKTHNVLKTSLGHALKTNQMHVLKSDSVLKIEHIQNVLHVDEDSSICVHHTEINHVLVHDSGDIFEYDKLCVLETDPKCSGSLEIVCIEDVLRRQFSDLKTSSLKQKTCLVLLLFSVLCLKLLYVCCVRWKKCFTLFNQVLVWFTYALTALKQNAPVCITGLKKRDRNLKITNHDRWNPNEAVRIYNASYPKLQAAEKLVKFCNVSFTNEVVVKLSDNCLNRTFQEKFQEDTITFQIHRRFSSKLQETANVCYAPLYSKSSLLENTYIFQLKTQPRLFSSMTPENTNHRNNIYRKSTADLVFKKPRNLCTELINHKEKLSAETKTISTSRISNIKQHKHLCRKAVENQTSERENCTDVTANVSLKQSTKRSAESQETRKQFQTYFPDTFIERIRTFPTKLTGTFSTDRPGNLCTILFLFLVIFSRSSLASSAADVDKTDRFLDKINEQSIAAIFNKVAYGSTTKRSIPDNAYLYTTLATPLLTTYRYSDGNQEWYRVDVKEPDTDPDPGLNEEHDRDRSSEASKPEYIDRNRESFRHDSDRHDPDRIDSSYGSELEKDHVLPTSAPAADILKNNNNKNYNNPNRYNNDRLRPDLAPNSPIKPESVTEREPPRTSTGYSILRNVRPTKSMFGKEVPSYVPPSRSFFTPPLPPEYLNPFADKPTLRGTNSESYPNRRPIPPPSLMPKKDRIPFRPDLPAVNESPHRSNQEQENKDRSSLDTRPLENRTPERKKTLNTPSQNVHLDRIGEFYGLNRLNNESNFEYEPMVLIPSISRILSGSNGRKEDIPDILLRTVTATPNIHKSQSAMEKPARNGQEVGQSQDAIPNREISTGSERNPEISTFDESNKSGMNNIESTNNNNVEKEAPKQDTTTTPTDIINLPNVKEKNRIEVANATKTSGHEVWHVCWNVHVYLVVFFYVLLAIFSIVKLILFDRETHMFSKSYFLSIHLLLTSVCVLRIFYLVYDPYNVNNSFGNFMYDFLHNFPLSLLATTFAVLIVFLLKRTLNHLKVKTRPMFLVLFGLAHMFLCFCLNLCESFEVFSRESFLSLVCRFVYILLCWSLGLSYVYLYRIIKNVLAKKSQNLSEMCSQNISYASHITIAVALLFTLLGFVQLYGLFFIKVDRFTIPYHWILWGFELSVRVLEISIVTLLAIVVSLRMSQREKQNVGFPLFPCTTSDSSTDNIYPNNCSTNLNALNYSLRSHGQYGRQELALENLPSDVVERPNLLKGSFQNDSFDKRSTLDRFQGVQRTSCQDSLSAERSGESASEHERDRSSYEPPPPPPPVVRASFERFERPNWGSQRFDSQERFDTQERFDRETFPVRNFERSDDARNSSSHFERNSGRMGRSFERNDTVEFPSGHFEHGSGRMKSYDKCKYYTKPKFDTDMYNNGSLSTTEDDHEEKQKRHTDLDDPNVYSEPLDVNDYERSMRCELNRSDFERRSKSSWNNSGRRSTGRSRKNASGCRPHMGVHTLPNQDSSNSSMLVDENGFVRFRQLAGVEPEKSARRHRQQSHVQETNHYSDA